MPTWYDLRPQAQSTAASPESVGCYLMIRPLPLALVALPAPEDVSLLVCMSSPMYLLGVRKESLSGECGYIRLQELVPALELLVFRLDDLNAVNNLHEACLELLGLSRVHKSVIVSKQYTGRVATQLAVYTRQALQLHVLGGVAAPFACNCGAERPCLEATYSIKAWRASWPIFSISSLLRRGLMVLASPSSYSSSLSSTWGLSRGMMMVPLDFLLPRRGRMAGSPALGWSWSLTEPVLEVVLMSSGYEDRRSTSKTATVG